MKPLSALIVDDDGYARDLLRSLLRELECNTVASASNGEEALKFLRSRKVDILFLDIEMPGINGLEALKQILGQRPEQYVVMISAHSTLDNVKQAIDCGARGFIVKPYTGAKVRDQILKFRQQQQSSTASSSGADSGARSGDDTSGTDPSGE